MTALRQSWTAFVSATKAKAASITDLLAGIGERMPSVASITATVNGVTITVTPKPPQPPQPPGCPTCKRPQ